MKNKISKELLEELNREYEDAVFEFTFDLDKDDYFGSVVQIKMKPKYTKYLDSYIINLDDETRNNIIKWFKSRDIDIMYNNTSSCFWATQIN